MLVKAVGVALAAVAALTVQAPPAAADDVCGRQVGGDILIKYREMGGEGGPLGCPMTDELPTPDGRGRYNHFVGGSIYWTPQTHAHPVWGAVRDKWQSMGWETSKLGYPVGDELTNYDGQGKRQQFEGGTVYWHPTLSHGAHPVWGRIGELWGQFGWEGGDFGYPTSDEFPVSEIKGVMQTFSGRGATLWWSPGFDRKSNHPVCQGECVGYQAETNTEWVRKTEIARAIENGTISGRVDISVIPTEEGFDSADTSYDRLWDQSFSKAPYPLKWLNAEQGSSLYKQLACHARYAITWPNGEHNGGESWDLEGWAPDVSWDYALNPFFVGGHWCNWYTP
jgi:uncharacterized protein with LGFP repeats